MCEVSARMEKVENFSLWKIGKFSSKIRWIGTFARGEKFPINRKIFHFSNFLENSEILYIRAYNCTKFQLEWRKWKIFHFGENFSTSKFSSKITWIGTFARGEKFPINRKIFHFSNFLQNSEILYIRAYKCAKFQTEWRKWKFVHFFPLKSHELEHLQKGTFFR